MINNIFISNLNISLNLNINISIPPSPKSTKNNNGSVLESFQSVENLHSIEGGKISAKRKSKGSADKKAGIQKAV